MGAWIEAICKKLINDYSESRPVRVKFSHMNRLGVMPENPAASPKWVASSGRMEFFFSSPGATSPSATPSRTRTKSKKSGSHLEWGSDFLNIRAGDETQTRDPQLGRLMLYQLSYSRFYIFLILWSGKCGESRIRTYEGVRQQIYSLPQLAALVSPQKFIKI